MNRKTFDILNHQPVAFKKRSEGGDRKIGKMLVIDGIELTTINQVFDVLDFYRSTLDEEQA